MRGPRKRRRISFRFITESISELKKVTWPTRQDARNLTTLVIIVSIAVGLILAAIDLGFSRLMNVILLRGP